MVGAGSFGARGRSLRILVRLLEHRRAVGWVAATLWISAALLGAIGWEQSIAEQRQDQFGVLTRAYAVVSVVTIQSSVEEVPLALAIARLLAPLAAASSLMAAGLTWGASYVHRRGAARAAHHTLLVGPPSRVGAYLAPAADPATVVHLRVDDGRLDRALISTPLHPEPHASESWTEAASARLAARIVLATGRDDQNLAALAALLRANVAPPEGIAVEVDNRSAALRLTVRLLRTHPDHFVEVICRDDVVARLACEQLAEAARELADADARPPRVAVVGDAAIAPLVALRCADGLVAHAMEHHAQPRPRLELLADPCDHEQTSPWPTAHLASLHQIEAVELRSLHELLRSGEDDPVVAFVGFADPSRTARVAVEIACSHPRNQVATLLGPLTPILPEQITSLDQLGCLGPEQLVGPLRLREREGIGWGRVAEAIRTIERHGYEVSPATSSNHGRALLRRACLEELAAPEVLGGLHPQPVQLLQEIGLAVLEPERSPERR